MSHTEKEGILLLFEGSIRAIPFNIFIALLLAMDLLNNKAPAHLVGFWLIAIIISSGTRLLFCHSVLTTNKHKTNPRILLKFLLLTVLMGEVWGSCYWLMLPYIPLLEEFIIILVFGGMCAGAIASLSVYLTAYYSYIFPRF